MAQTTPQNGHSTQHGVDRPVTLDANNALETPHGVAHPNVGKSIPDIEAIGDDSEPLTQWQKRNSIDPANQVKLVRLSHMRYQHPDLEEITTFLLDFGMHIAKKSSDGERIWYRGYGTTQYVYYAQRGPKKFLGGTFEVESHAELEKAAKIAKSPSSGNEELTEAPGGGYMLTLHDPEGFPINLLYGQEAAAKGDYPEKVIVNDEVDKPRVRKFNRFTPGPAAVHKLGHYGLCVKDFPAQMEWYTRNFNLAPTDFLIFDYWWDTTGNMIEHYADGDLVNKDTPVAWNNAGDESLAVWGPEVPKWFLE
ncbi:hypothetical protein LTR56_009076 [Elasticomyces elasticus]|nr:hypothetical protein LTR56_009076 [Elasticomyces elasticus]